MIRIASRSAFAVVLMTLPTSSLAAPVRESDPVLIGTKWAGKLTQRGTFAGGGSAPPEFDCVLTVTKRDRATFEAGLREQSGGLRVTYIVKGEVTLLGHGKGHAIAFRSVDAKDVVGTSAILGIPYTGTVSGRTMKGTWRHRTADGTDIAGDYSFELSK
jgi:hypothetical protein